MSKVEEYRKILRGLDLWDPYLLEASNLPGPRANLELAHAVAMEGDQALFTSYALMDAQRAPANSKEEFLAFCGVLGLGYVLSAGQIGLLTLLKEAARDARWRIREAVALGLQKYGKADMPGLLRVADEWSREGLLVRRAVVAALCEPDLLKDPGQVEQVLDLLDRITESISNCQENRSEAFRALRKALGYGWSVVVAAQPSLGKVRMERWIGLDDHHVRWIMTQNLKKKRLVRLDERWVNQQLERMIRMPE